MNRTLLIFFLAALQGQYTAAQTVLPATIRINRSKTVYNDTIPSYPQVSITNSGADNTSNTASDSAIILPIVLKSFFAFATGCNAMLQWLANDAAGDVYTIESSSDGVSFTAVKTVNADGASGNIYSFTLVQPDATKWYRLQMTGKNGSIAYSRMAAVNIRCQKQAAFTVYPNPVTDYLTIKYEAATTSQISIWVNDAAGKTVLKKDVDMQTGTNSWLLDVQALSSGLYYVQLRNDNGVVASQKVMKKD